MAINISPDSVMEKNQRILTYKFLSLAFLYPTEERKGKIKNMVGFIKNRTNLMENFLKEYEKIQDLQSTYISLFDSECGGIIPPYEGAYFDLFLRPYVVISVEREYIKDGLICSSEFLPDHISCEFEFMFLLLLDGKYDRAKEFFVRHIGNWVPLFVRKLKDSTDSIYAEIGDFTDRFIRSERKMFYTERRDFQ